LDADVKDLPQDPEANAKTGEIKGEYHQKMKGEESNYLKVSDNTSKVKGAGVTQKGNSSKSAADPYLKVTSEKNSATLDNSTIKVSGTQGEKSASDPYLKVTSEKKSAPDGNTTIKGSGTQSQSTTSGNFMKITDVKGEKE
jgi:hypothetical protein